MRIGKIGIYTAAVGLIATGVIIVLNVGGLVSLDLLRYLWPFLVILFGLEIIWHWRTAKETPMRFSGWSLALLALVVVLSLGQLTYLEPVHGQVSVNGDVQRVDIEVADVPVNVTGTSLPGLSYDGKVWIGASSQVEANRDIQSAWTVRQEGGTLVLGLNRDWQWGIHVPPLRSDAASYLNVQVPEALLTRVVTSNGSVEVDRMKAASSIRTSNGAVTVEQVDGAISAETSDGRVSLNNIAGAVQVRTSNGSVTAQGVQGDFLARTTNGRVDFQDVGGRVQASSSNGSITGKSGVGGDWTLVTSNGPISLTVPRDTSALIDAATSNAAIGGDVPWLREAKGRGAASLGDGEHRIKLHSSNGSISVSYGG